VSIKEKVSGLVSEFRLRFLSVRGLYEVGVRAVEGENIVEFVGLTKIGGEG